MMIEKSATSRTLKQSNYTQDVCASQSDIQQLKDLNIRIQEAIGFGGFGCVFKAYDKRIESVVALKVARRRQQRGGRTAVDQLHWEANVMKELQGYPNIPTLYYYKKAQSCSYIVMELLGGTLSDLKKYFTEPKAVSKLAVQLLTAIQSVHRAGYAHRDVTPQNFARSRREKESWAIIDFGMCKKYRRGNTLLREQSKVPFKGTVRYASWKAHQRKDLGRADDLISFYYVICELLLKKLPWQGVHDDQQLIRMKLRLANLVRGKFPQLSAFARHLCTLDFYAEPNYELLRNSLSSLGVQR